MFEFQATAVPLENRHTSFLRASPELVLKQAWIFALAFVRSHGRLFEHMVYPIPSFSSIPFLVHFAYRLGAFAFKCPNVC